MILASFRLWHNHKPELTLDCEIRTSASGFEIAFAGYGAPIFIEVGENGAPQVMVWADEPAENGGDPTHRVNLAGARLKA